MDRTKSGGESKNKVVAVERGVLEELIDIAKGDIERLIQSDGYEKGDQVVDDLVETVEAAERSLNAGGEETEVPMKSTFGTGVQTIAQINSATKEFNATLNDFRENGVGRTQVEVTEVDRSGE